MLKYLAISSVLGLSLALAAGCDKEDQPSPAQTLQELAGELEELEAEAQAMGESLADDADSARADLRQRIQAAEEQLREARQEAGEAADEALSDIESRIQSLRQRLQE
ncbi:MAG: hypothetical protein KC561_13025 [Myxococcales bacterium]|nr:hypothetical protein [Myxococcales bacterium]